MGTCISYYTAVTEVPASTNGMPPGPREQGLGPWAVACRGRDGGQEGVKYAAVAQRQPRPAARARQRGAGALLGPQARAVEARGQPAQALGAQASRRVAVRREQHAHQRLHRRRVARPGLCDAVADLALRGAPGFRKGV